MLKLFAPVSGSSWESHFVDNGWDSIQDQIDAGYPYFLQPTGVAGIVVFEHDFGALITASTLITLSYNARQIEGTTTLDYTISVSADGVSWTDFTTGSTRVYANNFRHVKVTIEATPADLESFASVEDLRIFLSTRESSITGEARTGVGGSVAVDITGEFVDVSHIAPVPKYSASYGIIAVYDFVDVPNPTSFTIYTYRADTGALVGGVDVTYEVRGVKA